MKAWNMGLAGLLGVAVACAGAHPAPPPSPVPNTASAESKGRIPVEVDNQNYSDMDVYLLDRGSRVLIGSVNGLTQSTLLLPAGATGTDGRVQLQADPIGAVSPIRTPQLLVAPGERVFWTIGTGHADSYASVG
ncbi:MAG TPA: hypothetical protein VJQ44_17725 [Gemmatimonadales bacterium]|nr:hypothetical protein [Gemmatimonadales bacterium]